MAVGSLDMNYLHKNAVGLIMTTVFVSCFY